MIIGITGTLAAGKGTIVDYLKEKGFKHYSVRAFLIEEIEKRKLENNRDSMVLVANELRKNNSSSYIAEQLYEVSKREGGNCIIESIRTVGEIKSLSEKEEFYLISVDAPEELRYERAVQRGSETDYVSFEEFIYNEKREMESNDPNKQNLKACIELSDFRIINECSVEDLHKKINQILEQIKK